MATILCPKASNPGGSNAPSLPDNSFDITPHDTNEFEVPVAVECGVAGNVVVRAWNGAADQTRAMVAGQVLNFRVRAVRATGTTATGLIAIY